MTTNETEGPEAGGDEDTGADRPDRPIARFVHEHPGMTIAGGIALGVLAAALIPRRNRNFVTKKSSALADAVSSAGLILYREALERAEKAGAGLRDMAGQIGQARSARPDSGDGDDDEAPRAGLGEAFASLADHLRGRSRN